MLSNYAYHFFIIAEIFILVLKSISDKLAHPRLINGQGKVQTNANENFNVIFAHILSTSTICQGI